MTGRAYADELDAASNRIGDISRADLAIMLRRAALRLRNTANVPLEPEWEDTLSSVAAEMKIGRNDLIREIIKDWLTTKAWLPLRMVDKDNEA